MKIELAHDIIAVKIWEQLPEKDKQIRQIKRSFLQRYLDYDKGKGSLLGEKELLAWDKYIPRLDLTSNQHIFIEKSRNAISKLKILRRLAFFALIILTLLAIGAAIWAWQKQIEANTKAVALEKAFVRIKTEQKEKAQSNYEKYLAQGNTFKEKGNYSAAIEQYNFALSHLPDGQDALDLIDECKILSTNQLSFESILTQGDQFFQQAAYLKARTFYKSALSLFPDNAIANKKLSDTEILLDKAFARHIEIGETLFRAGGKIGYQDALNQFKKAQKIYPNNKKLKIKLQACEDKLALF